jgi:phenylpropionate dioxygenase-like ring-hydroxylating dioxygenase large terminal subunit
MENLESLDGLHSPVSYAQRSLEVNANWKLLTDGIFEAYHFKVAHRQTIAHMFMNNLQLVDEFDLHRRLYLIKSRFPKEQPEANGFDPRKYGNLTYYFFPNTMILVQPDHGQLSYLEPLSASRTRIHEITLIPSEPATDKAAAYWNANVDLYRRTLAEDYASQSPYRPAWPQAPMTVSHLALSSTARPAFTRSSNNSWTRSSPALRPISL